MNENKAVKIANFRTWLMINDVRFAEKANGHFHIFDDTGKLVAQVWATTEKMILQEGGTITGLAEIQYVIICIQKSIITEDEVQGSCDTKQTSSTDLPPWEEGDRNPITENDIHKMFRDAYENNIGHMDGRILVVAVHLPTGATEIITNHFEVESKMKYYLEAYDEELKLKSNPMVRITGFMLV